MKLAVAALSARMLAEAAARDGFEAIALDVFGDADTRRACVAWHSVGSALRIDRDLLLEALRRSAAEGATGWVAGSGFEADHELLAQGAGVLPLLGTQPTAVRRVREPRGFFAALDRRAIAHPEVGFVAPAALGGWLSKSTCASGGWHIRRGASAAGADRQGQHEAAGGYWQREAAGAPMSALFVANRRSCTVLGCQRLIVRPIGASPYVYCGSIGPLAFGAAPAQAVQRALDALVGEFELCGLASLDFLLDGDVVSVLEVNPRPSDSMALYPSGTLGAHLRACLHGELPARPLPADRVRGTEVVYAPHRIELRASACERLAQLDHCHDVPHAPTRFERDDPVCSVSAEGADAAAVGTMLAARRDAALHIVEATE